MIPASPLGLGTRVASRQLHECLNQFVGDRVKAHVVTAETRQRQTHLTKNPSLVTENASEHRKSKK